MPRLEKGEKSKLNVTQKARHRVMAGISWDPADEAGLMDKVKALAGNRQTNYDLDLVCYIFGHDGNFIEHVSGETGRNVDLSEKIYHSGDNIHGDAEGDDEEISAELKEMPPFIGHLVFCVLVRSGQGFGNIKMPEVRLADGYTNYNFLQTPLNHQNGKDMDSFIFARLHRSDTSETGWGLHYIGDYLKYPGHADFAKKLKEHLI